LTSFGQFIFKIHEDDSADPELLNLHENDIVPWYIAEPYPAFQEKVTENQGRVNARKKRRKRRKKKGTKQLMNPLLSPVKETIKGVPMN
jgi:hypothetical protein